MAFVRPITASTLEIQRLPIAFGMKEPRSLLLNDRALSFEAVQQRG